jgi:hypothetical protein
MIWHPDRDHHPDHDAGKDGEAGEQSQVPGQVQLHPCGDMCHAARTMAESQAVLKPRKPCCSEPAEERR